MRTNKYFVKANSLRCEDIEDELMRLCKSGERELRPPESVLICHHHQPKAPGSKLVERAEDPRHESHLGEAIDLIVMRLFNQRAVAVDEQDGFAHVSAWRRRVFWAQAP